MSRRRISTAAITLLVGSWTWCQEALGAGMEKREVRIKMRDGIELVGDLYLPEGPGPFPTLVRKTPYERDGRANDQRTGTAEFFTQNGYAVLIVSMRGRYGSGGDFYETRNEGWLEHPDGYDTIEWAAQQSWCNSKIGAYGISSDGQWQMTTAPTRPPHLKAMLVEYAAHPRVNSMERGIPLSARATFQYTHGAAARPLRSVDDWKKWLADWRTSRLPLALTLLHPQLADQFINTAYSDYWREMDPATRYQQIDVPIIHESGWYDRYVRQTLENFNGIRKEGGPGARNSQKVMMGPWVHGGNVAPETETVKFGPEAEIDHRLLNLRWFDYWLKGIDNGIMQEPAVSIYLMGAERWLKSDTWPLPGYQPVTYYLRQGQGRSAESLNNGRLLREAPGTEDPDEYTHDPYDPVPTIGGHGGYGRMWAPGPQDQRPAEARMLTFTTDVLKEDLEVVGEIKARFFASSSAVDTDFVLTLTDVYPNGYSATLRQNAVRARYRLSEEKESLLDPGKVYEFTLTLDTVANVFKAGHRIRLSIASSSFPAYLPSPGTGGPSYLETRAVVAQNKIYHDSRYPSSIEVPVRAGKPGGGQ